MLSGGFFYANNTSKAERVQEFINCSEKLINLQGVFIEFIGDGVKIECHIFYSLFDIYIDSYL